MHAMDYNGLRKLLIGTMEDAGLLVKADEILYLNDLTRICELFIQRPLDYEATWAKVGFEWRAEHQAALGYAEEAPELVVHGIHQVVLHAAFHLHFDELEVDSGVIHEVTDAVLAHARRLFGESGAMVAELRMLSSSARIECLRYEVDVEVPGDGAVEWWHTWGALCASLLTHFDEIHAELSSRFGPTT